MRASTILLIAALASAAAWPAWPSAEKPLDLAEAVALADDPEQLAQTWERGFVAIPGSAFGPDDKGLFGVLSDAATQERLAALPEGLRLPVVVYLHGCAGIGLTTAQLPELAERAGFAVIAPNSFARDRRPRNCDPSDYSAGMFPPAWLYRRAELQHAVSQARELPWVDPERIVVAGFSEGGATVALWGDLVDTLGYIILGWTCTAPPDWGWLMGLRTPAERPVLAIVSADDPWFAWPGWRGHCGSETESHADLQSIVLEHTAHEVLYYPQAQDALVEFLGRWAD